MLVFDVVLQVGTMLEGRRTLLTLELPAKLMSLQVLAVISFVLESFKTDGALVSHTPTAGAAAGLLDAALLRPGVSGGVQDGLGQVQPVPLPVPPD